MGAGPLGSLSVLLLGLVCTSTGYDREQPIHSQSEVYPRMQVVWVVELTGRVCIFKHSKIGCEVRRTGV